MSRVGHIVKLVLALMLVLAAFGRLAAQSKSARSADKAAGVDSVAGAEVSDSVSHPAMADSALILKDELSAKDYLEQRERFFYPRTRREDPFDFPFGKMKPDEEQQLGLGDLELTGVLFSPDGRSVAILSVATGEQAAGQKQAKGGRSFLVRVGDTIAGAEVVMIEANRIHFKVQAYGIVRHIVKELKPLVEEKDVEASQQAGSRGR